MLNLNSSNENKNYKIKFCLKLDFRAHPLLLSGYPKSRQNKVIILEFSWYSYKIIIYCHWFEA